MKHPRGPSGRYISNVITTDVHYGEAHIVPVAPGMFEWVLPGGRRTSFRSEAIEAAKIVADYIMQARLRSAA